MSRAASAQAQKAQQKAALAEGRENKEKLLAMGLTSTVKKEIGDDKVLCISCGATQKGPRVCQCSGGFQKPATTYDSTQQLIDAAKERHAQFASAKKAQNVKAQGAVAGARAKKKDARDQVDLEAEFDGIDGCEIQQTISFPVGKLGMDIERNIVSKVSDGGEADSLKIQAGWVISAVDGAPVAADRKQIMLAITKVFKNSVPCVIKFRCPQSEGEYVFCRTCDKFLDKSLFSSEELAKAARLCAGCEEMADMFDDEEGGDF